MRRAPGFTLRRLEVFIVIAENGGFRAAAEKLGMAQPSVSAHVQALEGQAGGELFERRRGRGVALTDLGRTFLKHARQMLAEADEMAVDLSRTRTEADRRVVFACQRSLSHVLPPVLASFAGEHGDIELVTRVGRHEEIIDLLRSGAANIGLYLGNQDVPGLRSAVVGRETLAIVAAPTHPLAQRRAIHPAELAQHNFVGAPDGSALGESMLQILADVGAGPIKVVSKASEFEFLRALVIAGVGLYCCLRKRVETDLGEGHLVMLSLDAPPLMMDVRQAFSLTKPLSPAVALFAEFLRRQFSADSNPPVRRNAVQT